MSRFVPTATLPARWAAICLVVASGFAAACSTDSSGGRGTFDSNQGGSQGIGGTSNLGLGGDLGSTGGLVNNLGLDASSGTGTGQCKNLQCQQFECPAGSKTTVSGTVFDPAGTNPLYNVVVYVPNEPVLPFEDNVVKCSTCSDLYTGHPIASTLTGPDGKFVLENVPVGNDIPLVIQVGKWRRQIKLPHVDQCKDTPVAAAAIAPTPKHNGGRSSQIGLATGGADSLECLLLKIGIDPASSPRKTTPSACTSSTARPAAVIRWRLALVGSPEADAALWDKLDDLKKYDVVVMSCEGAEYAKTPRPTRRCTTTRARAVVSSLRTFTTSGSPTARRFSSRPPIGARSAELGSTPIQPAASSIKRSPRGRRLRNGWITFAEPSTSRAIRGGRETCPSRLSSTMRT